MSWTAFPYFPRWKKKIECDILDLKPGMFLLAVMSIVLNMFLYFDFRRSKLPASV